jgi:hypothetical protein
MKKVITIALIMLVLAATAFGQTEEQRKRLAELNSAIQDLDDKARELDRQKDKLQAERKQLLDSIAADQFHQRYESPDGYLVMSIDELPLLTLLVDGKPKPLRLEGVMVSNQADARNFLGRKLLGGTVLVRCTDEFCSWGFIYLKPDEPSLNAQLVDAGFAMMLNPRTLERARRTYNTTANLSSQEPVPSSSGVAPASLSPVAAPVSAPPYSSSERQPGTEVHVKGYYRKDGTYVRPHTRSAPGRRP